MRSRRKWMGPEGDSRNGKGKVREVCGADGARWSIAMTSGAVSFGMWQSKGQSPHPNVAKPELGWGSDYLRDVRMGHPAALNARSLHSTDHRFAMICSGRDDRVWVGTELSQDDRVG